MTFMKQYSFATIVSTAEDRPVATHLPFAVSVREEQIILTSHFARANPQWQQLTGQEILVIFSEPHAYISPSHYDKEQNVPTWDYFAVHAYGTAKLITAYEAAISVLEEMIITYEPAYKLQWDGLPEGYKTKMVKGIAAFEITVNSVQASKKLSQNKNDREKQSMISQLSASELSTERDIAKYMEQLK